MLFRVSRAQLRDTFSELRRCGQGHRECQTLWASPWSQPDRITRVLHPDHAATATSFDLDDEALTALWIKLAQEDLGVRVQVHTHPGQAYHSGVDDRWPLIHTPGFLSLVIPRFAMGAGSLEHAYLAELGSDGRWRGVEVDSRIQVVS